MACPHLSQYVVDLLTIYTGIPSWQSATKPIGIVLRQSCKTNLPVYMPCYNTVENVTEVGAIRFEWSYTQGSYYFLRHAALCYTTICYKMTTFRQIYSN